MAKGIRERLLKQAIKFHQWQEVTYPGKTAEEIGSMWEVDYPYWNDTYSAFCYVLTQMDAETADIVLLDEMVYLIARANEAEGFIQETTSHPKWFECLCRRAAASNENEAKWQFAAYLPECPCSPEIKNMILDFAKDPNEYVSRRALLAMPALRPDCVEQFAPLFWERNCYSPELQEYQRIAVLISLDAIHSDLLPQYLERAKQDGRSYLLEHAKRIEGGLAMNEKLSRPQFNQMDTTEKQTLMESLAARYDMTFLGLHNFDRWGQSCTTGIFKKDGREFVFVPGDTVTLGWEQFAEEVKYADRMFGGFINGKIMDSAIIGVLCYIGCLIFKFPSALLVSVIIGVTNVIPFFGPFIGAIPATLLILIQSPIKALWFVLFVLVLQQLDGNIIGPKILGNTTGLSSFWVLFAILLFGGLWGFVGMIVGVPLFAVIYDVIKKLVIHGLQRNQELTLLNSYHDQFGDPTDDAAAQPAAPQPAENQ